MASGGIPLAGWRRSPGWRLEASLAAAMVAAACIELSGRMAYLFWQWDYGSTGMLTLLAMAVWGGAPNAKSLRFFAEQGFQILGACYYDANDLNEVKAWLEVARPLANVRGFMYTPWQRKYALLPAFGDLLTQTGQKTK